MAWPTESLLLVGEQAASSGGSSKSSSRWLDALAACSPSSELWPELSSSRAISALSCCFLLTAIDEARLAARSDSCGEAGSGVASGTASCAASGEPLRAAWGAPPPRPTATPISESGILTREGRNGNGPGDACPTGAPSPSGSLSPMAPSPGASSCSAARWAPSCPGPAPAPNQTRCLAARGGRRRCPRCCRRCTASSPATTHSAC